MARISVTVSPGATRSEVVGRHGDAWKLRIAAPPERGRANEVVVEVLAAALGVARADIRMVAEHASRRKIVEVDSLGADEIERRVAARA